MFSEGDLFFCVFLSILYLYFCTGANILPFSRELAGLGLLGESHGAQRPLLQFPPQEYL